MLRDAATSHGTPPPFRGGHASLLPLREHAPALAANGRVRGQGAPSNLTPRTPPPRPPHPLPGSNACRHPASTPPGRPRRARRTPRSGAEPLAAGAGHTTAHRPTDTTTPPFPRTAARASSRPTRRSLAALIGDRPTVPPPARASSGRRALPPGATERERRSLRSAVARPRAPYRRSAPSAPACRRACTRSRTNSILPTAGRSVPRPRRGHASRPSRAAHRDRPPGAPAEPRTPPTSYDPWPSTPRRSQRPPSRPEHAYARTHRSRSHRDVSRSVDSLPPHPRTSPHFVPPPCTPFEPSVTAHTTTWLRHSAATASTLTSTSPLLALPPALGLP